MRTRTIPTVPNRLLALTAADLMTTHVTTIPADMSLREAGRLLFDSNISGRPSSIRKENASVFCPHQTSSIGQERGARAHQA